MIYKFETDDPVEAFQIVKAPNFEYAVDDIKQRVRLIVRGKQEPPSDWSKWLDDLYTKLCDLPWSEE